MIVLELRVKELALIEQLLNKQVSSLSPLVFKHDCKMSDLSAYTLAQYLLQYISHEKACSVSHV